MVEFQRIEKLVVLGEQTYYGMGMKSNRICNFI